MLSSYLSKEEIMGLAGFELMEDMIYNLTSSIYSKLNQKYL